ncbi:MAG: hypothetical protein ACI4J4_01230 [Ruminiclostridium sp.]
MKFKIFALFACIILIFGGCSNSPTKDGSIDWQNTEVDCDIVFASVYSNWAFDYQCSGSFIDKDGNRYLFDLSDKKGSDMLAEFEKIKSEQEGVPLFDDDSIKYMYALLLKVDPEAGYNETSKGCDMGQSTLYGIRSGENGEAELIPIYSTGDWLREPKDAAAKKLFEYYNALCTQLRIVA